MSITAAQLLHGGDEDFVVNAYLAILGRWPDEGGLAHHLGLVAGRPERRMGVLRAMLSSEEAQLHGRPVLLESTTTPAEAEAAQLRLRLDFLLAERRSARPPPPDPALAAELSRLAAELDLLGREMRDRMAALEAGLARALPLAPVLSTALSVDFVQDQIEAAQARLEARLRALEARMLEGG